LTVMHLLAQWRCDNYRRDLGEGAGFNFNSKQPRLHSEIEIGEDLWLFTRLPRSRQCHIVAKLVVRAKTINAPGYKYGAYRVWGDLRTSRYYQVRRDRTEDDAFELLRSLPLDTGTLSHCSRTTLAQSCEAVRGLTDQAKVLLEQFVVTLPEEGRARLVVDEHELERELLAGVERRLEQLLNEAHSGASPERARSLFAGSRRNRQLTRELNTLYGGRCQLASSRAKPRTGSPPRSPITSFTSPVAEMIAWRTCSSCARTTT